MVSAGTTDKGQAGNLIVRASESVELIGTSADGEFFSNLSANTEGDGDGGALTIETGRLVVRDGAAVLAGSAGVGQGGTLTVTVLDAVELIGGDLLVDTRGSGDARNLIISTGRLIVQDGAQVGVGTFGTGSGGNLVVAASESVELIGKSANSGFVSGLFATAQGEGAAGNVMIDTEKLIVRDGAEVSAVTFHGGRGGDLVINASDSVEVIGESPDRQSPSGLATDTKGVGTAGDLSITTGRLIVRDGAVVAARTFGEGRGGTLQVNASEFVEVIGSSANGSPSRLSAQTESTGAAGDLTIATGQLTVQNGALVAMSGVGLDSGDAGNLNVTADFIQLDNQGKLIAETESGEGGNIRLQVQDLLLLRHESQISTSAGTAQQGGNGGDITIEAPFIVAVPSENSDITANAFTGQGGNINITTQGIYGLEFRLSRTPLSDITASSEFGVDGIVEINQPDVDPSRGLAQLPSNLVDAEGLIDRSCSPGGAATRSSFTVTGRGGLSPNPFDPLDTDAVVSNWVSLDSEDENTAPTEEITPSSSSPKQIVEAQGWIVNQTGQIVLIAQAPTVTPQGQGFPSAECKAP